MRYVEFLLGQSLGPWSVYKAFWVAIFLDQHDQFGTTLQLNWLSIVPRRNHTHVSACDATRVKDSLLSGLGTVVLVRG